MKEKVSIIVNGLGGISSIAFAIYGTIVTLNRYRVKNEEIFFIVLLCIFGVAAIYTSFIAWKLLKNPNLLNNPNKEKSLLSLKAKKTRLLLEKEIRELEAENQSFASENSN